MKPYFADLHVHIGRSGAGEWIKIPSSNKLTIRNIITDSIKRKGMDIIGLVDVMSPLVLEELEEMEAAGELVLAGGGGYCYNQKIMIFLGAEIETTEDNKTKAHTLLYLPDINTMRLFSVEMSKYIRNIHLSSQNAHMPLGRLINIASSFGAVIIPAHVFTPFKSVYGACSERLAYMLSDKELEKFWAIELGLSSDSEMADRIAELSDFTFVTNSDAHSLSKIAREYNVLLLENPGFTECFAAMTGKGEGKMAANYGLDPRLGKYYRSFCAKCGSPCENITTRYNPVCQRCRCGSNKIIQGVFDRIEAIADYSEARHPNHRAPYFCQIPLEFVPGIGKNTLNKLLDFFGTEMNIIHNITVEKIAEIVGCPLAEQIDKARKGMTGIAVGGGGLYGKLMKS